LENDKYKMILKNLKTYIDQNYGKDQVDSYMTCL